MNEIPSDVQEFVNSLACRRCGTPKGRGLAVDVFPEDNGLFCISARCLRCGGSGYLRMKSSEVAPVVGAAGVDITSDEVLDLHEALKSPDWLSQLTKP